MRNRTWLVARLAPLSLLALNACGCVEASNAFDPDTRPEEQAKAELRGDLRILRGIFDPALMDEELGALTVVLLSDGEPVSRGQCVPADGTIDVELACDGAAGKAGFAFEGLVPGAYTLRVDGAASDLLPPGMPVVGLQAGESVTLETLRFVPVSDDGGEGQISGAVALEGKSGGARTVTLYRKTGTGLEVRAQLPTDADGKFAFSRLPMGTYAVSAELSGFTPDYKSALELSEDGNNEPSLLLVGDDEMVLFPATAVLVPSIQQSFGRYYTADDEVPLAVLAFGGISEMRLSHDAAFTTDDEEVAFVPYSASATVVLPDEEGPLALYGQFRTAADDGFTFTTGLFEAEVVRDVSAPVVLDVAARGQVPAADGTVYLREEGATLTLDIGANDVVSAVAGIAVVHEEDNGAGDPASLVFTLIDAPGGFVDLQQTVGLSAGEGEKLVFVYVQDRAGNVSEPGQVRVVVDATPPALGDEGAGIDPIEVLNASDSALSSRSAQLSLHVPEGEEAPRLLRVGQDPLSSAGAFQEFSDLVEVPVTGAHGATVQFVALVRDAAGNEAEVRSAQLTLDFSGTVSGTVLLEGVPPLQGLHGGTTVRLFAPGTTPGADAALAETTTAASGAFTFGSVPEGAGYLVEVSRAGHKSVVVSAPAVSAGGAASLGSLVLAVARGYAGGVFRLADAADDVTAHGGILVTAVLGSVVVAQTVTLDDGSYGFPYPGLPVTVGNERYTLRGSRSSYAPVQIDGVQVLEDETSVVNPDPGDATVPLPLDLQPLTGDFELCATVDPCVALLYTSSGSVRIKLRSETDISDVRFQARAAFDAGDAQPAWQGGYTPGEDLIVDLAGADGLLEVFLQLEIAGTPGPVLSSTITLDTVPPDVTELTLSPGALALDDGFTNASVVKSRVTAAAGTGDVAPLQSAYVAFADTFPGSLPAGATACTHAASCDVFLPGAVASSVEEKTHTAWAFSCDRAGNCSTEQVSARIVYDETPPQALHGTGFAASGGSVSSHGGVVYTRAADYDLDLDVGTAETGTGVAVTDLAGDPVPDAVSYRFISRFVGAGAPPVSPSFGATPFTDVDGVAAGAVLTSIDGPSLTGGDGVYRVYAQLKDLAGNATALENNAFFRDLTLDTTDPGATLVISGNAALTATSAVTLDLATAPSDPVVTLDVALDDGLFVDVTTFTLASPPGSVAFDLSSLAAFDGDGTYFVYGRFYDPAGNEATRVDSITLDTAPPSADVVACGSCSEDDSASYSGSRTLLLDVLAQDLLSGVELVRVVIDGGTAVESSYAPTVGAILPDIDGPHTVEVSFVDGAGNESTPIPLTVTLDRGVPSVSLTLNGGALFTASASVTLTLGADGDVNEMRLGNGSSFGSWQPFVAEVSSWTVGAPASDGVKTVSVEVRDPAGNVGVASELITLDTAPPAGGISVAAGALYTTSETVALTLSHPNDTDGYAVANATTLDCATATFTAIAVGATATSVPAHVLSAVDGNKTVAACFRDRAGNTALALDEIVLDTSAPLGTVSIENGAVYTQSAAVDVYLTAPSDIDEVALATSALDCDTASYEAYASVKQVTLAEAADPDGSKTVYACFRDLAGNTSSASDAIELDRANPAGSVVIQGDATYTTTRAVTLTFDAPDDAVSYAATDGNTLDCDSATYSAFTAQVPWTLPAGEGPKSVTVCLLDASGRKSSDTDSILVDTLPPAGAVSIAAGDAYAVSQTVDVSLTHPSDVDGYAIANDALDCNAVSYAAISAGGTATAVSGWTLSVGEGEKTVYACFRDVAGHVAAASDAIFLDLRDPIGTVVIEGGANFTTTTGVTLTLAPDDDVANIAIANGNLTCAGASYNAYTTDTVAHTLVATDGIRLVTVCFEDAAGRQYKAQDVIILDRAAPSLASIALNLGAGFTRSTGVALTLSATDTPAVAGVYQMLISEDASFAGAVWESFQPARGLVLSSGDGVKTVYVKVRDEALQESATRSTTITLDTAPPIITEFAHDGTGATNSTPVSLLLAASDDISTNLEATLNHGAVSSVGCGTTWAVLTSPVDVSVPLVEGTRYVRACVRDEAGNIAGSEVVRMTLDLSDPPSLPPPTVVAGSRRIDVSWAPLPDNGPAGIDYVEIAYSTAGDFLVNPAATVVTLEVEGSNSATITDVENRRPYFLALREVDLAGNVGEWSPVADVVPGLRQGGVPGFWDVASPEHLAPTVYAHGEHLWLAMNVGPYGESELRVFHCSTRDDCRRPDSWDTFILGTTTTVEEKRVPIVAHSGRIWIGGTAEIDPVGLDPPEQQAVIFTCDLENDCGTSATSWQTVELTSTGLIGSTRVALAASAAWLYVQYGNSLRRCSPQNEDCTDASNWPPPLTIAGFGLVATDTHLLSLNDTAQLASCDVSTLCNALSDFSAHSLPEPDGPVGQTRNLRVVGAGNYLYAIWRYDHQVLTPPIDVRYRVSRCHIASGCDAAGDWSTGALLFPAQDTKENANLWAGSGALHLARWNGAVGSIEYGFCESPETNNCADPSQWVLYPVDEQVPLETYPGVATFDHNLAVAYVDTELQLRLVLPAVPSPVAHAATGAVDVRGGPVAQMRWSPLTSMSGYEQVYDFNGPPTWGTSVTLPDSLLERTTLSLGPNLDTYVSLRAYDAAGDLSDDAATWVVRPLAHLDAGSATPNTTTTSCPANAPAPCAEAAFSGGGLAMSSAWIAGTSAHARVCDASTADCTTGSWPDVTLPGTAHRVTGTVVTRTHAFVLVENTTALSATLYRCALTSACDAAADWTGLLVQDNASFSASAVLAYSLDDDKLYVAVRNDTPNAVLKSCTASSCAALTSTVTGLPTPPPSLSATPSEVVLSSSTGFVRYDTSAGTFTSGTLVGPGSLPSVLSQAAVAEDGRAVVAVVGGAGLYALYCPSDLRKCTTASQWGRAFISKLPVNDGVAVDVIATGGGFAMAYRHSGQVYLKQCRTSCHDPDHWRGGEIARDRFMLSPTRNQRFFWKNPTTKLYGVGYYGQGLEVLNGGKAEGPM